MNEEFVSQEYEVAQAGAGVKDSTARERIIGILGSFFFSFTIVISIAAVSFSIIFFLSEVDGSSMMKTINASYSNENKVHDSVLVNRHATPQRGDIIVVRHYITKGEEEYYIKRLIGIGGDKIRFIRTKEHDYPYNAPGSYLKTYPDKYVYKLVVNDKEVDEWYLDPFWGVMAFYGDNIYNYIQDPTNITSHPTNVWFRPFTEYVVTPAIGDPFILVPKGQVFYMGDNRGSYDMDYFGYHSHDCTAFGPQDASYIEGVVADIIKNKESVTSYVFKKLWEFISLKWIFG